MKTAVIMQRQFNGKTIRQHSKSGFLNLNDLYACYAEKNPKLSRTIDKYIRLKQTKEFADILLRSEVEAKNQITPKTGEFDLPLSEPLVVMYTKIGKNGGTWVHPYMFLDFAMWLDPTFKLWAMKIIDDKLIDLRNEAGDKFKEMQAALKLSGAVSPRDYAREASMINNLVFEGERGQRDSASEDKLNLLNKLQKYNAHLISKDMSFYNREVQCKAFVKFYNFIK